ncbi:MAG: tetratricopeptide repeat protein [Planctomycetota bacterium]
MILRLRRRLGPILLSAVAAACAEDAVEHAGSAGPPPGAPTAAMTRCADCHADIVAEYLGHAMANSLGPVVDPPRGEFANPATGVRYVFDADASGPRLVGLSPDGGVRVQRLVGRLGAGLMDTSWVATESDAMGGLSGRLSFAPVETLTGHGLALAPFERDPSPAGLDQPVTADCLGCHTTADVGAAARAPDAGPDGRAYPANLLGADVFERVDPLGCDTCHGDGRHHADVMEDLVPSAPEEIGIARLGELDAGAQRDVCARCHLEGDALVPLAGRPGFGPQPSSILHTRPVIVPAHPDDDYRLVSQLERLALSACFTATPSMTCTSCHMPHRAVAAQGTADFDARCLSCHGGPDPTCSRDPGLRVRAVSGEPARTAEGCVDCHVRRSQPFDLPGLRTADHFVRRDIPLPDEPAMRHHADPEGRLAVFTDARTSALLDNEAGRRWTDGVVALGLYKQGLVAEALARLDAFPEPGTDAARVPTAPPGVTPLETSPTFHFVRGLALEAAGRPVEARAAYADALALDRHHPEARLNRAALALDQGDTDLALADAALLVRMHPEAEKPWTLRARAALRLGDLPGAAAALATSTRLWPSDPAAWHELGRMLLQGGQTELARSALAEAARLSPGRPGLAEDQRRAAESGP